MDEQKPTPAQQGDEQELAEQADEEVSGELDPHVVDRLAAYAAEPVETDPRQTGGSDQSFTEDHASDAPAAQHTAMQTPSEAGQRRFGRFGRREPDTSQKLLLESRRGDKRPKKLVGLEIGASQIAAAQVVNNDSPELVDLFREPIDPGLVVSGEIRDPDALGDVLKRFFELHKLPKRGIRLGVSNNRIGVRVFEIEGVADPLQLENAIRFRAEEVLPIPLDEAVLDYVVLDEAEREDGTPWRRILLVVAYREVVDR